MFFKTIKYPIFFMYEKNIMVIGLMGGKNGKRRISIMYI